MTDNKNRLNEERKEKYQMLIRAGFSPKEATRYKDHSMDFVEELCNNNMQEMYKAFKKIKEIINPLSKDE